MRRALVLLAVLFFAGAAFAQPAQLAPCLVSGTDCAAASGAVTGALTSGRVTLSTGATSVGDDAGLTGVGTGTGFKLGIGTDVFISRSAAGTLLVEDGSGNARDVQVRKVLGLVDDTLTMETGANSLYLSTSHTSRWVVHSTGLLFPAAANTYDIGATGLEVRTGYFGTALYSPLLSTAIDATGTNTAGANLTIQPQAGTGSAPGSSIVFQTPTAGASGTTAQTQTTRLTLSEGSATFADGVSAPSGAFSSYVYLTGSALLKPSGSTGKIVLNDVGGSDGVGLDFDTDGILKVRTTAHDADAQISASRVITPVVQLTLATPTTSGDTCVAGTFWADASYLYVCTATNTIKRAALSAF